MRRIVIMDGAYWEALRKMAEDKGYKTRNALIVAVLKQVVDREPEYLEAGVLEAKVRYVAKEMSKPWNPKLAPPPADVMEEIFGDDLDKYGKTDV